MSGNNVVLDSNAVIYASNGTIDVECLLSANFQYCVSIITFIEVYAHNFSDPAEKEIVDQILKNLEIIDLGQDIADQAVIYRKNKSKKIKLPDAVILATARRIGADLITHNLRDFENIDPAVNIVGIEVFRI